MHLIFTVLPNITTRDKKTTIFSNIHFKLWKSCITFKHLYLIIYGNIEVTWRVSMLVRLVSGAAAAASATSAAAPSTPPPLAPSTSCRVPSLEAVLIITQFQRPLVKYLPRILTWEAKRIKYQNSPSPDLPLEELLL